MKNKFIGLLTVAMLFSVIGQSTLYVQAHSTTNDMSWRYRSVSEIQASFFHEDSDKQVYVIQWGDTLAGIAQALNSDLDQLAAINGIDDPDFIKAGAILILDHEAALLTYSADLDSEPQAFSLETGEPVEATLDTEDVYEILEAELEPTDELSPVVPDLSAVNQLMSDQLEADIETESDYDYDAVEVEIEIDYLANETIEEVNQEFSSEVIVDETAILEADVASELLAESEIVEVVDESLLEAEAVDFLQDDTTDQAYQAIPEELADSSQEDYGQLGRAMVVDATAYSTHQVELSDYTAMGYNLHETTNIIAVDPSVIPLGTRVYIPGYGEYIAGDTGSAIVGNRIDIHMTSLADCYAFGRQSMTIYILD